jgi:catechol-2,3-dioxygenase
MKRVTTSLSSIVLFCRNLERTTGFYTSVLGLKVTKQSEYLTELRDQRSNVLILRKSTGMEAVLTKGYSPILCFTVDNFESANEKLKQYDLPIDGEIIRS